MYHYALNLEEFEPQSIASRRSSIYCFLNCAQMSCKWLAFWLEIASIFLSYMHETRNVSFVPTEDNKHASHITAVSRPCMVGYKTCHGCDRNIPTLFFCHACCTLHAMPWANISFLCEVFLLGHGILSAYMAFCQPPYGVVATMVTWYFTLPWVLYW